MKTKLQLGNVKVEEIGLDISNVTVEAEYDMKEMFQMVDLMKHITASMPEILENLANAYLTFEDASRHVARIMSRDEDEIDGEVPPVDMCECEECNIPSKEDMIKGLLGAIHEEVKRRKEKSFEDTLKEVREVAEENAKREEIEEVLAEIKADMDEKGMPEFLQEPILKGLEEDLKSGKAKIKRK